jgi:Outer membrane protein beta-barrel domain
MRLGVISLLVGTICLMASAPARAQYGGSKLEKWEFTPFVGYETPGSFPLNSTSGTVTINDLRVNGATSFGTFIGYSIWSSLDFEFMWDRNLTSYSEQATPGAPYVKAYNSTVDQYQFGPLFTIFGEEHKLRPYLAGGLGFTHEYNTGGNPARLDFSYSIGGGVKYALTHHLSFRGDARYMPTYANSGLATYCDAFGNCFTAKVSQYQHRGNFLAGLAFRF